MLRFFARTDKSPIATWWWTVDRWLVAAVIVLIGLGYLMALAAAFTFREHWIPTATIAPKRSTTSTGKSERMEPSPLTLAAER